MSDRNSDDSDDYSYYDDGPPEYEECPTSCFAARNSFAECNRYFTMTERSWLADKWGLLSKFWRSGQSRTECSSTSMWLCWSGVCGMFVS